ncbi:pyrroline-5-carboxylate reductase [Ruminococcaceae bacterium OttesenSCG-928-A11]|nr:pyrroline-5-carboxylate reductase [Ruminococcaceae bacterium OttesenSCG-928-A11]
MLKEKSLGFIGAGQMCEAIMAGALKSGAVMPEKTYVCDLSAERLDALAATYGVHPLPNDDAGTGASTLAKSCDIVVLSVKPQYARQVLAASAAAFRPDTLVISIMGGITIATLEAVLPQNPVIRVMPNTPMLVSCGAAGIATGGKATADHLALCKALFDLVGESYVLPENLIDPLTAVSGCGPAFAYLFIEALADGGVEQGLPRPLAQQLAAQTLVGAGQMVLQTGRHPGQLKDSVCSPGGGTIVGVHALEDGAFRSTVMNAVALARKRMEELGK